jgi:hypothetical protein
MTNEELDEARAKEALRIWDEEDGVTDEGHAVIAARLARENWTPPEPEPVVDPDVLAWREWAAVTRTVRIAAVADAYLAGARMARKQEQERANPVVAFAVRVMAGVFNDSDHTKREARKAVEDYSGEAR